jgi:hypothetical protein
MEEAREMRAKIWGNAGNEGRNMGKYGWKYRKRRQKYEE